MSVFTLVFVLVKLQRAWPRRRQWYCVELRAFCMESPLPLSSRSSQRLKEVEVCHSSVRTDFVLRIFLGTWTGLSAHVTHLLFAVLFSHKIRMFYTQQ